MNDTRVVAGRLAVERPGGGGEVLLVERRRGRPLGGARAAVTAPPRRAWRLTGRSSSSSTSARGAGSCGSRASRPGRCRCRRTSTSRSPIPSATRRCTRDDAGVGRGADGRPALHAGAPRAARRRARHAPRRARHVPAARGGDARGARAPRRALRGRAGRRGQRIRAAARVLAVGTTTVRVLETLARGGAARRPHGALRHARLRVPPRRRAPDELPPSALDAARARDGVRRRRGDAARCTGSPSRSGTASTRSATRCLSCELPGSSRNRRRRARGRPDDRARRRADARVHAGRDEGDGEGARPGRAAQPRRDDRARQHVPPALPAGRRT